MTKYFAVLVILMTAISFNEVNAQTCLTYVPTDTPDSRYVDNGDGTVSDQKTGLMWMQCTIGRSGPDCGGVNVVVNWVDALNTAAATDFANFSDWRLPNVNELRSIVSSTCHSPSINTTFFPNTISSAYWTSTPSAEDSRNAWRVAFSFGSSNHFSRSNKFHIRLVRDIQAIN